MSQNALISIAVDGPVGAGKSSLCDAVGERLGILHLDTGAMYRAVGLYALRTGISPLDEEAVSALILENKALVDVDYKEGHQRTSLNGEDVSESIRTEAVGNAASSVSRYREVRRYLAALQRHFSTQRSLIVDGRDIGTVILPQAKLKIFLTASPEARAKRRYDQLLSAGKSADYHSVYEELIKRDAQDQGRAEAPLKAAEDAVMLDTSSLSFDESVEAMLNIIKERFEENDSQA